MIRYIYFFVFCFFYLLYLCSIFYKKSKYLKPIADFSNVLAVVPAHNEEFVIADLIRSLYVAGFKDVLVVADNCTDGTVRIALENKAHIISVHFGNKDKALKYALSLYLKSHFFTGFFFFDADNVVDKDFLKNASNYLGSSIVQFRVFNKNNDSVISRVSNYFWSISCLIQRGSMVLFKSGFLSGSAFYVSFSVIDKYLNIPTVSITDDFANTSFSHSFANVVFIDDVFVKCYNENVANIKDFFLQRLRWARGYFQLLFSSVGFRQLLRYPVALVLTLSNVLFGTVFISSILEFPFFYLLNFVPFWFLAVLGVEFPDYMRFYDFFFIPFFAIISQLSCLYAMFTFDNKKWYRIPHKVKGVVM